MTNELATRWMVTFGDSSVIVPGRRMHAREAYVAAAPTLGHPHFSEVTCDDIGPEEQASDEPGLGPQEFIPHSDAEQAGRGDSLTWAESMGTLRANDVAGAIVSYLEFRASRASDAEHAQRGLAEERDSLLAENARLRGILDGVGNSVRRGLGWSAPFLDNNECVHYRRHLHEVLNQLYASNVGGYGRAEDTEEQ